MRDAHPLCLPYPVYSLPIPVYRFPSTVFPYGTL